MGMSAAGKGDGFPEIMQAARQLKRRAQLVVLIPQKRFLVGDFLDVIHARQAGPVPGAGHRFGVGDGGRGDEAVERAAHAQFLGKRAGVNALNARDAVLFQILRQRTLGAPIAHHRGEFADGEAGDLGLPGLDVLFVDAVIADERIGHGDDLGFVGRIGQDFLVAGHGSVEADLAAGLGGRAEALAVKHRAVFES